MAIALVLVLTAIMSVVTANIMSTTTALQRASVNDVSIPLRLENIARETLESQFIYLRDLGTTTSIVEAESGISGISNETRTMCRYFPRTDDLLEFSSPYLLTDLANTGTIDDEDCAAVRPAHSQLTPTQRNRIVSTTPSNGNPLDPANYESSGDQPLDLESAGNDYRSIFPWYRLRSSDGTKLSARYGSDFIDRLNSCAVSAGLIDNSTQTIEGWDADNANHPSEAPEPVARFRFQQDMDGLGQSWIDLGWTRMNHWQDGLTYEANIWMGNETSAERTWQRIFDMGRGQGDGNSILAYRGETGQLQFQMRVGGSSCQDTDDRTIRKNCGSTFYESSLMDVPRNSVTPVNSLSESGGNDLWYYIAVVVQPADSDNEANVSVYLKCTGTGSATNAACTQGDAVAGGDGLRRILNETADWDHSNAGNDNVFYQRRAWVGKSHWTDDDFRGKMRDVRVWDQPLHTSLLGKDIVTVYNNSNQASIFSNTAVRESTRISPIYDRGDDKVVVFTANAFDSVNDNTWNLVACAWNDSENVQAVKSATMKIVGNDKPVISSFDY